MTRKNWGEAVLLALAIVVLVSLAWGTADTRSAADTTRDTANATADLVRSGRDSRLEYQARQTFPLCSRSSSYVVAPEKRADVAELCKGYETMDRALRTERAKQAAIAKR